MEDKVERNTQVEPQKEKRILKNEDSSRDLLENMKHNNIFIKGIPEGEKRAQGIENLFEEIMAENFPNLVKEKDIQVQKVNKIYPEKPTPRHIIIEWQSLKTR